MQYQAGLSSAGTRPYGNGPYIGSLAHGGLLAQVLAPVFLASAMPLGANMAAVRAQTMTPGRAVLDALAKGSVAALVAGGCGRGTDSGLDRALSLALLFGAGFAIAAMTIETALGFGKKAGAQP